jgi:polyhydroxybutyrate depolymerase
MLPLLLALAGLGAGAPPEPAAKAKDTDPLTPGRHNLAVTAAGHEWAVAVHVPKGYDPARPVPLVLILHGAAGNGPMYLDKNNWADKADRETFVAVAPTGLPPRPARPANFVTNPAIWNTGQVRPGLPRAKIDDVAFVRTLLDGLSKRLNVDAKRVYVVGHSNGAGLAFRLGAELSGRFAAVAAYAGYCFVDDPKPEHPRPTLFLVGTEDPFTPLAGGGVRPPWGLLRAIPPVGEMLAAWAKGLGCPGEPKTVRDKDGVKVVRYGPGQGGAELEAWYIQGQGHNWPGGKEGGLPERLLGPQADTVNATDVIWDFFKGHPMP